MKITRKILIIYTLIWIFTSVLIVVSSDYLKEVMYEESIKDVLDNATYILIAINCFVVLIMGVITTRIFEKKITLLNTEINNINTNNTTSGRIHESKDEFSILIKDINSMFQSMEEKNNIIAYNEKKIQNWVAVQMEQLQVQIGEARKEVESILFEEMMATDSLQKKDIRKKLLDAKKRMEVLQKNYPKRVREIQTEAQAEITRFNKAQAIRPILLINIVLKF